MTASLISNTAGASVAFAVANRTSTDEAGIMGVFNSLENREFHREFGLGFGAKPAPVL